MTTNHNRERLRREGLRREGNRADKTIAILAVIAALVLTFWGPSC